MTGFAVTGTDTDVGKTVFAAALAGHLDGWYWKPVQAGMEDGTDAERVAMLSGLPRERILPEAYRLATPCSPHSAAQIDGVTVIGAAANGHAHAARCSLGLAGSPEWRGHGRPGPDRSLCAANGQL